MRIPVYGELFRSYDTKVDIVYTVKGIHPYKGMPVRGWCEYCFLHTYERKDWAWFNEPVRTKGTISDAYGNLMPVCNSCYSPMKIEYLDNFKQVNKIITQTRCKYKRSAGKSFRYRMDPVSNTGNWKGGYSAKRSGLLQAVKEADKYPKFTRGRRSTKALQDALWRETHTPYGKKSWKDCTKKRYQWMKKFNKSKWSIEKQDRLWEEYLFNNDNYMNLRFITKLNELVK